MKRLCFNMLCFPEVFQQTMIWIAFPVIIKTFAKFSFPSLSMEDVYAQANAWNQHWGRGGYGSNTCFHEPTNGAKFKLCFPETLINYDRDWRCSGKRDIWISINPSPLFSPVIMNQVGLVTKLTINNTLMLNSQQRWNSIVNHSRVRPSGHGQGIVWSELLWYLATDPSCAARHEREKERVYN